MNQLKAAVTKALGSKILGKGGSTLANQVFAHLATVEQADCNHTFTEVDGPCATPAQMLLLTLLTWSLGGSVIGFTKRHYLFPVEPSDERIVDALKCINTLPDHPTDEQLNEAISRLFKADYVLR